MMRFADTVAFAGRALAGHRLRTSLTLLAVGLVPQLGMAGAALAASLAYGGSVLVLVWLFARHAGLPLGSVLLPGAQLWADLRSVASRRGGSP